MPKVVTKMFLHGSKDDNYERGRGLGLEGSALDEFAYALYEVEFGVEVDTETGRSRILSVDGRPLGEKP